MQQSDPFSAQIAHLETQLTAVRARADAARRAAGSQRPGLQDINPSGLYTRDEAAALARQSVYTLIRAEKVGLLRVRRVGGRAVRYLGADLLAYAGGGC